MSPDYKPELMHVDIPPEEVRDLAAEARARKALRFRQCERCGKDFDEAVSLRRLQTHQQTLSCIADWRTAKLRNEGYQIMNESSFVHRVMQAAGLAIREELTNYERGKGKAWGHGESRKATIKKQLWAPRWIFKLFENAWRLTENFSNEEVLPLFGIFLRELSEDKEKRAAAFAAHRLGGESAIRSFVLTPAFRAKKKRDDAAKKRDEAAVLEREADELDPPPESS